MDESLQALPLSARLAGIERIVLGRRGEGDSWTALGDPIPDLFPDHAERMLRVHRAAHPDLEVRLIRRRTYYADEVLDA